MDTYYKKIFKSLPRLEVSNNLTEKIISRIQQEQRKYIRIRFYIFSFCFVLSIGLCVFAWNRLQGEIVESGVLNFLSLIFTSFSSVVASWQDFVLSLFEYLPSFSIMCFLATIFMVLVSLRMVYQDYRKVLSYN